MKTVILCGCGKSEERMVRSLSQYAQIQCVRENELIELGRGNRHLAVYCFKTLPKIQMTQAVLVLGNELKKPHENLTTCAIPVFDPANQAAVGLLFGSGGAAISCGSSPKDTFSLASISENSATVSQQRSVYTVMGQLTEPKDLTVLLNCVGSVFEITAFCAVAVLCGLEHGGELCFC